MISWKHGWHDSFVIFVFPFYGLLVLMCFFVLEDLLFPLRRFAVVPWPPGECLVLGQSEIEII